MIQRTQRLFRLRPAHLMISNAMPATSGIPSTRDGKRMYQAGVPSGANTKIDTSITKSKKLVPQRQLLQEVWGPAYETETNYLRVYMAQLRRKLEPDPAHPRRLITEPGMGYRFVAG